MLTRQTGAQQAVVQSDQAEAAHSQDVQLLRLAGLLGDLCNAVDVVAVVIAGGCLADEDDES
ncbi:hypothetical protein [Streptomyces sp. NL15-2K]|uniref:hypothetical protein n=1 Tax=Streptomyces sp. NL15-2K TaxID=376149 RepID=UPI000FFB00BD|nr:MULTISPECIES: hypothetical protein [Actinomycetes]WKX08881.1 hypothetical protein Q4V64_15830 [Kutzneria buriramensis]GCB49627.1 hypothetical protein SNL152K_6969 [Streptomyces sp. NL15-2K]